MAENDFAPKALKRIKPIIERMLQLAPDTRNSDKLLAVFVWKEISQKDTFTAEDILSLPSFETIRRTRQRFQELMMYLPTDEKTIRRRHKNTDNVLAYLHP